MFSYYNSYTRKKFFGNKIESQSALAAATMTHISATDLYAQLPFNFLHRHNLLELQSKMCKAAASNYLKINSNCYFIINPEMIVNGDI